MEYIQPHLALRPLQFLANENSTLFPNACNAILHDTYVDDIVTGCFDLEGAKILRDELISLLHKGGFKLHKWSSNESSLLENIPRDTLATESINFSSKYDNTSLKILGLQFNPINDNFYF